MTAPKLFVVAIPLVLAPLAAADVVLLNPVADAFVDSAQPTSNYGGAGAAGLAAAGLPRGEFQGLLRFDTVAAVSSFNAAFGAGQWTIQSVTLRLTAASPNNAIFNAQAAGQFAAGWMQNDSWIEGTGTPGAPGATGITFATLPGFLGGADESIGSFAFNGSTSASATYPLSLTAGFLADASAGGLVSFRLSAADSVVAYLFNSRSFGTVSARPELAITATPAPAGAALLAVGAPLALSRRRARRS